MRSLSTAFALRGFEQRGSIMEIENDASAPSKSLTGECSGRISWNRFSRPARVTLATRARR